MGWPAASRYGGRRKLAGANAAAAAAKAKRGGAEAERARRGRRVDPRRLRRAYRSTERGRLGGMRMGLSWPSRCGSGRPGLLACAITDRRGATRRDRQPRRRQRGAYSPSPRRPTSPFRVRRRSRSRTANGAPLASRSSAASPNCRSTANAKKACGSGSANTGGWACRLAGRDAGLHRHPRRERPDLLRPRGRQFRLVGGVYRLRDADGRRRAAAFPIRQPIPTTSTPPGSAAAPVPTCHHRRAARDATRRSAAI